MKKTGKMLFALLFIIALVACNTEEKDQTVSSEDEEQQDSVDAQEKPSTGEKDNQTDSQEENQQTESIEEKEQTDSVDKNQQTDPSEDKDPTATSEESTLDVSQYENALFEGDDGNGFIYQVTFSFTSDTEGTLDLTVIEESSSNKIEEIIGAKVVIDHSNIGYFSYTSDQTLDGMDSGEGQIVFKENSIEFSRYRSTVLLNKIAIDE